MKTGQAMQGLRVLLIVMLLLLAQGCAVNNTIAEGAEADLMLHGYDPVSYFDAATPLKGRSDLVAHHRHGSYRFASAQNRARFLAAPDRFVPQYGGFCAKGVSYAIRAGGDPLTHAIRDGRLFIFVNDYARDYWRTDPPDFIAKADLFWQTELADAPVKWTNLKRFIFRVPHYKTYPEEFADYEQRTGKPSPARR